MGWFSKLKEAVGDLHDNTKWLDPIGHYSLDLAHQSSTDIVNETSRAIENAFGKDTWLGGLGEHWKNMSQKDKDDFGRWLTNTGLSAAAIYGGASAAGGAGGGAAGGAGVGAGESGVGVTGAADAGTVAAIGSGGAGGAGAGAVGAGVVGAADAGSAAAIGGGGAGAGAGAGATAAGGGGWGSYVAQGVGGLNSLYQAYQSQKAADALLASGDAANATQRYIFDTLNAQRQPYLTTGYAGLQGMNKLLQDPSSITTDPGYEFQRKEGMRGIESGAAARGLGLSGAALKAANRFNTDYATTKFNDSYNRFASAAGLGQVANQQASAVGMNYGNNVSQTQMGMGNAAAANYLNQGNIYGNALNQFGAWAGNQNWGG
jgi:hypothetical protein